MACHCVMMKLSNENALVRKSISQGATRDSLLRVHRLNDTACFLFRPAVRQPASPRRGLRTLAACAGYTPDLSLSGTRAWFPMVVPARHGCRRNACYGCPCLFVSFPL